jgi:hypothetical protein
VYELHIGTFTPEGTFDSTIERIPYLKQLGVTFRRKTASKRSLAVAPRRRCSRARRQAAGTPILESN